MEIQRGTDENGSLYDKLIRVLPCPESYSKWCRLSALSNPDLEYAVANPDDIDAAVQVVVLLHTD